MSTAAQQQFPGLLQDSLPDEPVLQLRLTTIPHDALPIKFLQALPPNPPVEDRVTDVVPDRSPALINSSGLDIFRQVDASLNVTREIFLDRVVWVPIISTANLSDTSPVTETHTVRVGLTLESGADASEDVKERESFAQVLVKYGNSEYKFSREETQAPHQVVIQCSIPTQKTVYGYQRKYFFTYKFWFKIKADHAVHVVGPDGSPDLVTIKASIRTEEILFREEKLTTATTRVAVTTVDAPTGFHDHTLDIKRISDIVEDIKAKANRPVAA